MNFLAFKFVKFLEKKSVNLRQNLVFKFVKFLEILNSNSKQNLRLNLINLKEIRINFYIISR